MALIEFKDLPDISTPINAENLNNNFNELKNNIDGTIIWTNPDITQEFAGQSIIKDLSKYKKFTLRWVLSSTNNIFGATEIYKNAYNRINTIGNVDNFDLALQRDVALTEVEIRFTDCYGYGIGTFASQIGFAGMRNKGIIPYQIIGYE